MRSDLVRTHAPLRPRGRRPHQARRKAACRLDAHFQRLTAALGGTELPANLEMLEIPLDHLTPTVLQYVNHAIATAGYITAWASCRVKLSGVDS